MKYWNKIGTIMICLMVCISVAGCRKSNVKNQAESNNEVKEINTTFSELQSDNDTENNESQYVSNEMVYIDANPSFTFRYAIGSKKAGSGEGAPIENGYYISKYMVSCHMYKEFIDDTGYQAPSYWNGSSYPEGKANDPVLYVSYEDAVSYCEWLSGKDDKYTYRLPTESEWENAAYAPLTENYENYDYPWGSDNGISYDNGILTNEYGLNCNVVLADKLLREYGSSYVLTYIKGKRQGETVELGDLISIKENGSVKGWADHNTDTGIIFTDLFDSINKKGGTTIAVNEGYCNYYGLYGMSGNAWSWTSSFIDATNGLENGKKVRAVRGGSWYATIGSCSANTRGEGRADNAKVNTVGFRLAADK